MAEVTPRASGWSARRAVPHIALAAIVALIAACGGGGGGGGSAPAPVTQRNPGPAVPVPTPTQQPPPPPTSSTGPVAFANLDGMRMSARAAVADNPREEYKASHYLSAVVYSSGANNDPQLHKVEPYTGDRAALLCFLETD